MKISRKNLPPFRLAVAVKACALALSVAGCAVPSTVPAALEPAPDESLAMVLSAKGVQIYECRRRGAEFEWAFVAPEAELFDSHGRMVGRHGAGPSWEARDGSKTMGTVRQRADAPIAGAIPWLLLSARNAGPEGALSRVTSIQRVDTAGGVAPATPCAPDVLGTTARVGYTAEYRFFVAK